MKLSWRILSCFFIMTTFVTLGCQGNPSEEVVVTKGNESKVDIIIEHEQKEINEQSINKITVPAKLNNNTDIYSGITINYNADVIMPELEQYPVYEVLPAKFSQKMVDKFIDYFADGRDIFVWRAEATKEDRERELIDFLKGSDVDGNIVAPDPDDPYIEELKEKIRRAPDSNTRQPANTVLQPSKEGGEFLNLAIDWGNNEDALITVSNFENGTYDSSFVFSRGGTLLNEYDAVLNGEELKGASISKEEAVSVADATLNDLAICDMKFSSIVRADLQPWENGRLAGLHSRYKSSGYIVIYTRCCDGLSIIDTSDVGIYSLKDTSTSEYLPLYSAPWYQEMIMVYVDENGVSRFSWNGYEKVCDKLKENVQLMDFEEVIKRADKQLFYQNGGELMYVEQIGINVESVKLGWSLINKKNELGKGLLVPAWFFFYDKKSKLEGSEDVYHEDGFLVLNAIDGSVINPFPTS